MACFYDFLVNLVEGLRGEKHQIVFDRLKGIFGGVFPAAVAQHLPDNGVVIGQVMYPVVVRAQPQSQDAQYEDLPLLHAGTPPIRTRLFAPLFFGQPFTLTVGNDLLHDCEDPLTQVGQGVDILQPQQKRGDVIPGFGIDPNVGNIDLTESHLGILDKAHTFQSAKMCDL
jgi:hypothetical protein